MVDRDNINLECDLQFSEHDKANKLIEQLLYEASVLECGNPWLRY